MAIDSYFEVDEEQRRERVEEGVVPYLEADFQQRGREMAHELLGRYAGMDMDVLEILCCAAQQGRFFRYAAGFFRREDRVMSIAPSLRRTGTIPQICEMEAFFVDCYRRLGVTTKVLNVA